MVAPSVIVNSGANLEMSASGSAIKVTRSLVMVGDDISTPSGRVQVRMSHSVLSASSAIHDVIDTESVAATIAVVKIDFIIKYLVCF